MLSSLQHGGPDDEGIFIDNAVALGHRRLSIIDLSDDGHQPMISDNEQVILSYNGEIYNYQVLKAELESTGIAFKTKTDTEVLLRAYEYWGTACFNRLEGIFAFAIYDKNRNKLVLARDHVGIKPLYYHVSKDELIFSSEVKAFKALRGGWQENEDWKILFLAFGSLPHPHTTLATVYQLAPGSFLEFDIASFTYRTEEYYKPASGQTRIHQKEEALSSIRLAVEDALRKNMQSDAPLGIFLSGGIDSSLLTILADKIEQTVKTVSVNFEDATLDERPFQQMVLDRTQHLEHHSYNVTESIFWENLDDVWRAMDQPSIDGVNTYFVSQCARKAGLKAVLSGVGADEIFGGYESIRRIKWLKRLRWLPFKKMFGALLGLRKNAFRRIVFLSIPGAIGDYLFLRGIHTPDVIARILAIPEKKVWRILHGVSLDVAETNDSREYVSMLESRIYLANQLLKDTDYMSMWHGLEVRAPFLDVALLNKVADIDPSIRYSVHSPKYLLTAPNSDILPDEIVYRKKAGFTFPFALWMKNNPERFKGLLPQGNATEKIVHDFEAGHSHWSKYWSLIVMQQFKVMAVVNCASWTEDPVPVPVPNI
jgi:asparagine synthase (glutamine-hydrolysing)